MFYIFFAFLFSFMLCASESVGDIEGIPSFVYFDDAKVNLKMTERIFRKYYETLKPSLELVFSTREHGNDLQWQEISDKQIVLLDIQMPGLQGNQVAEIISKLAKTNLAQPPCIIAVTTLDAYLDQNYAKAQGFYAGVSKIQTNSHIEAVLDFYYSWLKEQKKQEWALSDVDDVDDGPHHRKACDIPEPKKEIDDEQTRRAWKISDAVNEDVYIEGLVEAYPPTMVPRAENTGGDSPEHSTKKVTPIRKAPGYRRKVFPYSDKADSSSKQNDGDDTESYLRKCMEMLGNGLTWLSNRTNFY